MIKKLKNTLKKNLKPKIEKDDDDFNFGLEFEAGGIGAKISTENGGTVGIGIGIAGIEYNAEGGGSIELLNGLYKMEVERRGCSYVKNFYIGEQYIYSEIQLIPNCDPEKIPEPPDRDRDDDSFFVGEDKTLPGFPDDQWGGGDMPGDPDDVLIGYGCYDRTTKAFPAYNLDGNKVRDGGTGYTIYREKADPVVSGEAGLLFYSCELEKKSFRGWATLRQYEQPFWITATPDYGGTTTEVIYVPDEESDEPFGTVTFYAVADPPMDQPIAYPININRLVSGISRGSPSRLPWAESLAVGTRKEFNNAKRQLARFYSMFSFNPLIPQDEPGWSWGYTSWQYKIIGLYNLTYGVPDWQAPKKNRPGRTPTIHNRKGTMNKKCCFTKNDRALLQANAIALNSMNFPGVATVETTEEKVSIDYQFPVEGKIKLKDGQTLINNYLELKDWQTKLLLEMGGNGTLVADIAKALGVEEILSEGFEYPNKWVAPRGKGKTKALNYLQLFKLLTEMLDHLGIHPVEATLADLNPAKPGDQPWGIKTNNATHAIKLLLEYIKETDGDQAAALNLNLRESILLGELFIMVASIAESQASLFAALGFEVEEETDYIDNFPFDYTLGADKPDISGKGFGKDAKAKSTAAIEKEYKKILKELAGNDEKGAEAVLERFLQTRKQPYTYNKLKANQSLLEVLKNVQGK